MDGTVSVCKVLRGGVLSTVQDLGRRGHYSEGIPKSGAFDDGAFRLANRIVGNPISAAGIEVLLGGLSLEFLHPTSIAVTGGDLGPTLDGQPLPMWQKIAVQAGQSLNFSRRRTGLRAYVAFIGGLDVPLFLGSRSTYLFLGRGGLDGRKLREGDILAAFEVSCNSEPFIVADVLRPSYSPPWKVRVVYGLQHRFFTDDSLDLFESSPWTVTPQMDRMGLRLSGPTLQFRERSGPRESRGLGGIDPSNIPSEGNPLGSIQCPAGSELIVIGPDGPCEGGYAKLGTVITADFSLFAQMMPGDIVTFESVSLTEAYESLHQQHSMITEGTTPH